jgi:hypothetical protein
MSSQNFTVFLSSLDSSFLFPDNFAGDFTIKLPEFILRGGTWIVTLVDFHSTGTLKKRIDSSNAEIGDNEVTDFVLLCTDIVQDSIVRSRQLPILRRLTYKKDQLVTFSQWLYTNLKNKNFDTIIIYLLTDTNPPKPYIFKSETEIRCTLYFKRIL